MKKISIIVPVFNEEQTIPLFYNRLKGVLKNLSQYNFEIIFTNNRSTDNSLSAIQKIKDSDSDVHVITFSRNFGYQASVLAGMTFASGDGIVVIDVDGEDPPELILDFVKKWEEGHDVCYGIRGKRIESKFITMMRLLFYRILKTVADTDIILDMAEFSLISNKVRDTIIKNANTYPFLRAEIAYSGFRKIGIPYDRQARLAGKSGYSLWRMTMFGVAGILTISTFPLRLAVYFIPIVFLINIFGLYLEYMGIFPAFVALVIFDLLFIASILTSQGLYIARIYKNGIGRPVYIVDWDLSDPRLNSISNG